MTDMPLRSVDLRGGGFGERCERCERTSKRDHRQRVAGAVGAQILEGALTLSWVGARERVCIAVAA